MNQYWQSVCTYRCNLEGSGFMFTVCLACVSEFACYSFIYKFFQLFIEKMVQFFWYTEMSIFAFMFESCIIVKMHQYDPISLLHNYKYRNIIPDDHLISNIWETLHVAWFCCIVCKNFYIRQRVLVLLFTHRIAINQETITLQAAKS